MIEFIGPLYNLLHFTNNYFRMDTLDYWPHYNNPVLQISKYLLLCVYICMYVCMYVFMYVCSRTYTVAYHSVSDKWIARNVIARWNIEFFGSNPIRGMDICMWSYRHCDGLITRPMSSIVYMTENSESILNGNAIPVAEWSKACTVFARSEAAIVSSYPREWMFSVCVFVYR
jgi:hypothetical protein